LIFRLILSILCCHHKTTSYEYRRGQVGLIWETKSQPKVSTFKIHDLSEVINDISDDYYDHPFRLWLYFNYDDYWLGRQSLYRSLWYIMVLFVKLMYHPSHVNFQTSKTANNSLAADKTNLYRIIGNVWALSVSDSSS